MMENTIIKKENYEGLKSTSISLKERLIRAGFTQEEIEVLGFKGQINEEKANIVHGSSFAHFSSFLYYEAKDKIKVEDKSKEVKESRKQVEKKTGVKKDWDNIDILQDWDKISGDLKGGYVFIGANASTGAEGVDFEYLENFHNFGSSKIAKYYDSFKSNIDNYKKKKSANKEILDNKEYIFNPKVDRYEKYKTKEKKEADLIFFENNIHGSYVTDLIKGFPTYNTNALKNELRIKIEKINKDKKYVAEFDRKFSNLFVDILVDELGLLGNVTHTLIIMNAKTNTYIEKVLKKGGFIEKYKERSGKTIKIFRVNHYSSSTAQYKFQDQLEKAFGRV